MKGFQKFFKVLNKVLLYSIFMLYSIFNLLLSIMIKLLRFIYAYFWLLQMIPVYLSTVHWWPTFGFFFLNRFVQNPLLCFSLSIFETFYFYIKQDCSIIKSIFLLCNITTKHLKCKILLGTYEILWTYILSNIWFY